jgi:hypothetical protein
VGHDGARHPGKCYGVLCQGAEVKYALSDGDKGNRATGGTATTTTNYNQLWDTDSEARVKPYAMRHAASASASAPQAKKHVIGDYAALAGETLITRCPIWCPFDFGFYAIQCRSVRDQNPKNIQKTKLLDSCCGAMQISAKWAKSHLSADASVRKCLDGTNYCLPAFARSIKGGLITRRASRERASLQQLPFGGDLRKGWQRVRYQSRIMLKCKIKMWNCVVIIC